MLSRVADAMFWMARYMERSSCLLRVVRTHYIASQEEMLALDWKAMVCAYAGVPDDGSPLPTAPQAVLHYLMLDRRNGSSILNNITRARENARAVQDHITKEMWQSLNDFYHLIRDPAIAQHLTGGDPVTALDQLIRQAMLYYGMADTTMAREEASHFLNAGKFLERAIQCAVLLEQKLACAFEPGDHPGTTGWRSFLYSMSGYELYMKTFRGGIRPSLVLQLAILNTHFPHSLLYCLQQIQRHCESLKPETESGGYQEIEFLIGNVLHLVRYSRIQHADRPQIEEFLRRIRDDLHAVAGGMDVHYFGLHHLEDYGTA